MDDWKRLKVSFEELLKEVGPGELLQFANSLHLLDKMGLKLPW